MYSKSRIYIYIRVPITSGAPRYYRSHGFMTPGLHKPIFANHAQFTIFNSLEGTTNNISAWG